MDKWIGVMDFKQTPGSVEGLWNCICEKGKNGTKAYSPEPRPACRVSLAWGEFSLPGWTLVCISAKGDENSIHPSELSVLLKDSHQHPRTVPHTRNCSINIRYCNHFLYQSSVIKPELGILSYRGDKNAHLQFTEPKQEGKTHSRKLGK